MVWCRSTIMKTLLPIDDTKEEGGKGGFGRRETTPKCGFDLANRQSIMK